MLFCVPTLEIFFWMDCDFRYMTNEIVVLLDYSAAIATVS